MATIAIIAAGAMGSAIAQKLTNAGCTVLTNLDGRSEATRQRARKAGMEDVSLIDIVRRASWVLSILPPRDAFSFAQRFIEAYGTDAERHLSSPLIFADCNAVNPDTVKKIAGLFASFSMIRFVDAAIIGGPPSEGYDPTLYASAADEEVLVQFVGLSEYGLKISSMKGEGTGVGDASALKMSYAGILKGTTGLFATMILAAHASSPATGEALLRELQASQPMLLQRITRVVPPMLPKAYRWVGEMEEIAGFVGEGERDIYQGLAKLYERIERSVNEGGSSGDDVSVLEKFVEDSKKATGQR